MNFRTLDEAGDFAGKKVILRLDLNVPIKDGTVLDDFRIRAAMPSLNFLKDRGAKVVIISHIGEQGTETLRPIAEYMHIQLLPLVFGETMRSAVDGLQNGEVMLLENLRRDSGEAGNNEDFAKQLASLVDIYINDAFSVSHRNHASIVLLPRLLPSYAGFSLKSEIDNLSKAFEPEHPFLFILGGAKFETKINLVRKFINIADQIFVGGALSNTIFKKMGYEVGKSMVDDKDIDLGFVFESRKVFFPADVMVLAGGDRVIKKPDQVLPDENMLDVGGETMNMLKRAIDGSKFVLWNGPLGNYEKGFKEMTEELAKYISNSSAKSIVGGGDTLASIQNLGIMDKFTFVSSGGGAMLDFLANGTLPGIEALSVSSKRLDQ